MENTVITKIKQSSKTATRDLYAALRETLKCEREYIDGSILLEQLPLQSEAGYIAVFCNMDKCDRVKIETCFVVTKYDGTQTLIKQDGSSIITVNCPPPSENKMDVKAQDFLVSDHGRISQSTQAFLSLKSSKDSNVQQLLADIAKSCDGLDSEHAQRLLSEAARRANLWMTEEDQDANN